MKTSKDSDGHIMAILKQPTDGTPVPSVCLEHGMSSASFYKWRNKYSDANSRSKLKAQDSRLKELKGEHRRLKIYANVSLDEKKPTQRQGICCAWLTKNAAC